MPKQTGRDRSATRGTESCNGHIYSIRATVSCTHGPWRPDHANPWWDVEAVHRSYRLWPTDRYTRIDRSCWFTRLWVGVPVRTSVGYPCPIDNNLYVPLRDGLPGRLTLPVSSGLTDIGHRQSSVQRRTPSVRQRTVRHDQGAGDRGVDQRQCVPP